MWQNRLAGWLNPGAGRFASFGSRGGSVALVLAALCVGAYLRFTGLDWGLRQVPHSDEQLFVANVVQMVVHHDLDQRFYLYPGLFFYFLLSGLAWLPAERLLSNDAYLVARFMVAGFGVASVAGAYLVGRALTSSRLGGVAAAFFLATSPVSVDTAHQVRPDVLLEGLGLFGAYVLFKRSPSLKWDARAGVAVGLATAVKFTGILLAPCYVLAKLIDRKAVVRGCLLAGGLTIAIVAMATPYALIRSGDYSQGPVWLFQRYYPGQSLPLLQHLLFFLKAQALSLGWVGALLALAGAVLAVRSAWRQWLPLLVLPPFMAFVMATGSVIFERYILLSVGVLYVLAALALATLARRRPVVAGLLLALAVIPQGLVSARASRALAEPSPEDHALDFLLAAAPSGARILETREEANLGGTPGSALGLPRDRFEIVFWPPTFGRDKLTLLASNFDFVVTMPEAGGRWARDLETAFLGRASGGMVRLRVGRPRVRPEYREVDLRGARFALSLPRTGAERLFDGARGEAWSSERPPIAGDWIEIELDREIRLGQVEVWLAEGSGEPRLRLFAGEPSQQAFTVPARPHLDAQVAPYSQLLLVRPLDTRHVRLEIGAGTRIPWRVTEISLRERR